jgi:hypothetical protein
MEKLVGRDRVGAIAIVSMGVVKGAVICSIEEVGVRRPSSMGSGTSTVGMEEIVVVSLDSSSSSPLGLGPRFIT